MQRAVAAYKEDLAREAEQRKAFQRYQVLMGEANELIGKDKLDEGLAKVEEAVKLLPGSDASDAEMQKFDMLMGAGKYDRAYAIAAKLVAGPKKDDPMALNMISWSIVDPAADIEKPNVDLALKAAEQAVKLTESKEAAILDTLARCHWVKGNKAKAIELQTAAVALCAENSPMRAALQRTLEEYKD
jgi:tetratricopeptide (TPR) repeat protein